MIPLKKAALILLWLVLGALVLSFWWLRLPDFFFGFPGFIRDAIVRRSYGCCEAAADVEAALVFAASFLILSLLTALALIVRHLFRRR